MEKHKLKEVFHSLFNKINNIFTAVGSNKMILEEDLNKLSSEELKQRISDLADALRMIEKNILILNKSLQEVYESLKREESLPVPGSSSPES